MKEGLRKIPNEDLLEVFFSFTCGGSEDKSDELCGSGTGVESELESRTCWSLTIAEDDFENEFWAGFETLMESEGEDDDDFADFFLKSFKKPIWLLNGIRKSRPR